MSQGFSIREQVLGEVQSRLAGEGWPATGGVFRSRLDQIEQSELPCYDISPGDMKREDPGEFGDHDSVTYALTVSVRAMIDAAIQSADSAGVAASALKQVDDSALDPFYVWAVQQLTGGAANLGGLALGVEEVETATVFQPNGRDILGLDMTFEVKFATKRGDPTQKG